MPSRKIPDGRLSLCATRFGLPPFVNPPSYPGVDVASEPSSPDQWPPQSEPSIRHASIWRSPGPAFLAMMIGSHAGFRHRLFFGNPEPYIQQSVSRMSQPASSIATASRCHVRVPPNASRYAPG